MKTDHLPGLWFVGCGGWDAAEVSVFEPVGVAFEGDDVGVVDESIIAAATTSLPKTSPQRPKGLLEVTISEARS